MVELRKVVPFVVVVGAVFACSRSEPPVVATAPPAATDSAPAVTAAAPASPPAAPSAPPPAEPAPTASAAPAAASAAPAAATIACKTIDDCWFGDDHKPIARPAKLRGKKITPCKGGNEHAPACADGVCIVRAFKC